MVEFGLKLEDNKVAEWSGKYIDYERLKALLKRSKNAAKHVASLEKRRPEIAAEIKAQAALAAHQSLSQSQTICTPINLSDSSLNELAASDGDGWSDIASNGGGKNGDKADVSETASLDEKSSLLPKGDKATTRPYGSQGQLNRDDSDVSVTRKLVRAVSGVSGFFSRSSYESKFREALLELDLDLTMFSQSLYQELEKVNNFYDEKSDDIEKRLDVLIENVYSMNDSNLSGDLETKDLEHLSLTQRTSGGHKRMSFAEKFSRTVRNAVYPNSSQNKDRKGTDAHHIELVGEESDDDGEEENPALHHRLKRQKKIGESDSIKRAITDLHRSAKLLNNFAIMNYTGFVKIIKKHDKTFPDRKGTFSAIIDQNVCHEGKEADQLAERMEKLFADWFCDGNVREARAKMLPKRGDGLQMDWSQLRLGFRLGMCSILALWVCWDCIWGLVAEGHSTIGGRTAFPVFRACGGLLLLHWFWGFSVYIWTRYRINYIFLFDFNPRIVDSAIMIFNDVVDETLVFLVCMLLYYKSGAHDIPQLIPAGCYPFILVLYTVKNLIFPWRARAPLWRAIWSVITAPLTSPSFFHTYVADVFTSMVKVFQDILWTLCFVFSGDFLLSEDTSDGSYHEWQHSFWYKNVVIPLICLAPLWIRFNQCLRRYMDTGKRWPNLANAFKYAMSQTVTLFGAFHPLYLLHFHNKGYTVKVRSLDDEVALDIVGNDRSGVDLFQLFWMTLFVASSLYSFTWDVYMDWGLGRPKFAFLGPRLMFPKRAYYYAVIFADLFLRFMWVLTLVPPQSGANFELPSYLAAMTMSLELMRRTIWGFFRLEHEHRHNTEGYRRVDFVPLHFTTGHDHKYKRQQERVGWNVLAEVGIVSAVVIAVGVSSVLAAERAARFTQGQTDL